MAGFVRWIRCIVEGGDYSCTWYLMDMCEPHVFKCARCVECAHCRKK